MQDIQSDFSAATLVRAIKANWADYYHYLGRSPNAELYVGPYLTWLVTGIPDPFMNVVLRAQLPSDGADELIDQALTHFRSRKVTRLSWWMEEGVQDKRLTAHGLTFSEGGTGMAADLMALPDNLPAPTGLTIVPVADKETLKQWIHVASIGFGLPHWGERIWYDVFADLVFEWPLRNYLAVLNGQPVGTSQLFLSIGVAGIYNVTCVPEARQQGVGAAITLAPLLEARRMGYRISILQASHLGYRVYRRLGFQEYGSRLDTYLWENETPQPEAEGNSA